MLDFNYDDILDVELELTTYCNAECPLCYRNYKSFKEHYPKNKVRKIEDVITQLDLFKNLTDIKLVGTISEPTLYNDFFKLIRYCNQRDLTIEICTNGDTHDSNWWEELGKLIKDKDSVYFTICGSTQEIHEIYRKGTKLKNILKNAESFRKHSKTDYAQCIRFKYNDDDFNSVLFKKIVSEFSNVYMTETYLRKDESNYVNTENLNKLLPHNDNIKKMKTAAIIADTFFKKGGITNCKAQQWKRVQINIDGEIYPCYLFLEASKGINWDKDWQKINNLKYECCKFCQKNVLNYCLQNNISSII